MLDYSLVENLLTERKDDYSATPHPSKVYNRDEFIEMMLGRGTLVTKTDIVAVLNNIEETAAYIIREGGTINLPLFNTSFSMPGVYEGINDSYDANRHRISVNIHKGTVIRNAEKEVKVKKVSPKSVMPQILEVKDSVSGLVDEVLTSGGAVEISGVNIRISGTAEVTGLYFVSSGGVETAAATLITNKPSSIIALIPQLAFDTYQIKIVTQFAGSNKDLKEPRTAVYSKHLTVQ